MLRRKHINRALVLLALGVSPLVGAQDIIRQPGEVYFGDSPSQFDTSGSVAYPDGDFQEQLAVAGGQGDGYLGGCDDDWGCGGSPYRTGPGCGDNFRVGPRWRILLDGVMMYRDKVDLEPLAAAVGTTLADAEQYENFEHGGGVRLLATAFWPQCKNYEVTMGYIGVEEWNANVILPVESLPPIVVPPVSVGVDERRTLNYNSSLHALELDFQAVNNSVWKPFAGIRYFSLDETVEDRLKQYPTTPLSVTEAVTTRTFLDSVEIDNNLIGFQLGIRRDLWRVARKVYIQGFVNAGMYCNFINRVETDRTTLTRTEVLEDDPETEDIDETGQVQTLSSSTGNRVKTERTLASFAGEASLTLVWKINNCCALRSGYEVMVIDGVELADDAFLGTTDRRDLLFHGAFAGFEYRR